VHLLASGNCGGSISVAHSISIKMWNCSSSTHCY